MYIQLLNHVYTFLTFFWNGNSTGEICANLETYVEIKSDPNEIIEDHPEMKADEVSDALLEAIESGEYGYLRVNYANGDMVGHTGNFNSAVWAVKKVDESLGKIVPAVLKRNGVVLITADHGNCEEILDKKGRIVTSHSLNPVPCIILDSQYKGEYLFDTSDIETPGISNVMATFMNLMGYEAPEFYEKSLLKFM